MAELNRASAPRPHTPWFCRNLVCRRQRIRRALTSQRTKMTKTMAKTALASVPPDRVRPCLRRRHVEHGHLWTDRPVHLCGRVCGETAGRHCAGPPVRITHWRADDDATEVRCTYDSCPGSPHALSLLVIPGNVQAPDRTEKVIPLLDWLRQKHAEGVVLAAVCGGVFILARTGLLAGRQATTHWSFSDRLRGPVSRCAY